MNIILIAAMAPNRVIGVHKKIPWHLSADLKYFKRNTLTHPIIMGRETYESIGKPLKERLNIVLSSRALELNKQNNFENLKFFSSLEEALAFLQGHEKIFIIGGEKVYKSALPLTQTILLTLVHNHYEGDTFFPVFENDFLETSREDHQENDIKFSFITYIRKKM